MSEGFRAALGHRIRVARTDARMTQEDVARRLGVDASYISRVETGKTAPSVERLIQVADALDVSLDELAGRE